MIGKQIYLKMEEFFTIHKNELPPLGRISLVSPFFTNKKQLSEIKEKIL